MMSKIQKFYICEVCHNLVGLIENGGGALVCCGAEMTELVANTVEASVEKHLPNVKLEGDTLTVEVGSVHHPMIAEHFIPFIYVETAQGGQRKRLELGKDPVASFTFTEGDKPVAVYAYCNLHGMWKTDL